VHATRKKCRSLEELRNQVRSSGQYLGEGGDLKAQSGEAIEAGKISLDLIPFDVADLVSKTLKPLVPMAQKKGLDLRWEVSPEAPRRIVTLRVLRVEIDTEPHGSRPPSSDGGALRGQVKGSPLNARGRVAIPTLRAEAGLGLLVEDLRPPATVRNENGGPVYACLTISCDDARTGKRARSRRG